MRVRLVRFHFSPDDMLGLLYIDDKFSGFTVEDEERKIKVPGETCIPEGVYLLGLRYSPKFTPRYGHEMIEVIGVPGFTDILFHPGNTEKHTAGCILMGNVGRFNPDGTSRIEESVLAYNRIYPVIAHAIRTDPPVTFSVSRIVI